MGQRREKPHRAWVDIYSYKLLSSLSSSRCVSHRRVVIHIARVNVCMVYIVSQRTAAGEKERGKLRIVVTTGLISEWGEKKKFRKRAYCVYVCNLRAVSYVDSVSMMRRSCFFLCDELCVDRKNEG